MPSSRRTLLLLFAVVAGSAARPADAQSSGEAPPAAPTEPAAPAPPGAAAAPAPEPAQPAKPGVTGGYSWTDKPVAKRRRAPRPLKLNPNAPLATYPGFRMLQDGSSRVSLRVTRSVDVGVHRAPGSVTYVLPGVQVGVRNNTNPLVTTHFNTPLARARLVRGKAGAELVLELRESGEPKHRIGKGPYGSMLLEVVLPRSSRDYSNLPVAGGRGPGVVTDGVRAGRRGPRP